jgi:hypothetical protein
MAGNLSEIVTARDGTINPAAVAEMLGISNRELAELQGLSLASVCRQSQICTPATQRRLRDFIQIIDAILPWCGSIPQALAWYCHRHLGSFGGQTAEEVVKAGHGEAVKRYVVRIAFGGFA